MERSLWRIVREEEREERKGLREKRGRQLRERNVRGERKKGD